MTQPNQQPPQLFVWYTVDGGTRVPKFLVPAQSRHEAAKVLQSQGHTLGYLGTVEEADPADLLRLTLPGLVMQLGAIAQLLAIIAQDAGERINERTVRHGGRGLGLVKPS